MKDLVDLGALEFVACLVGNEPGGDGNDGVVHQQIVFLQGGAGFHDVYDDVGKPQNGGNLNGSVQVDDVDIPTLGAVVILGDVGEFRRHAQGAPGIIPESCLGGHGHAALAQIQIQQFVNNTIPPT